MIVFIAHNICTVIGEWCGKGLHTFSVAVLQLHCTVFLQNGCAIFCCQTKRKIRLPGELVQGDLIFHSVKLGIKLQSGVVTVGVGIRERLELLVQADRSALLPYAIGATHRRNGITAAVKLHQHALCGLLCKMDAVVVLAIGVSITFGF